MVVTKMMELQKFPKKTKKHNIVIMKVGKM